MHAGGCRFVKELKKKKLMEEDYAPSGMAHESHMERDVLRPDLGSVCLLSAEDVGLRVYELEEGKQGPVVQPGDRVVVSGRDLAADPRYPC